MQIHLTNHVSDTTIGLFILLALLAVAVLIITLVSGKFFDWVISKQ